MGIEPIYSGSAGRRMNDSATPAPSETLLWWWIIKILSQGWTLKLVFFGSFWLLTFLVTGHIFSRIVFALP